MRTDAAWMRLVGPAMLVLVLGVGAAWAEETIVEGSVGEPSEEVAAEDDSPNAGEGVEGEVTVTAVEDSDLPPGFCSACEEDGEIGTEVLAENSDAGRGFRDEDRGHGFGMTTLAAKAQAGGVDVCTSREHYVAWLCDWKGYSRP